MGGVVKMRGGSQNSGGRGPLEWGSPVVLGGGGSPKWGVSLKLGGGPKLLGGVLKNGGS